MLKRSSLLIIVVIMPLLIAACGTSTGSRYEKRAEKAKEETKTVPAEEITEDFDIKPYRTKLIVEDVELKKEPQPAAKLDVWYGYDETTDTSTAERVTELRKGYRVQVLTTDNLEQANELRSEVYFKTNQTPVYVIFDPPFYKVKAGDFTEISDANDLNFKLNQMGYTDTRVVSDSVNVHR